MTKNRKIKKAIAQARKPDVPFEEFAKMHNIDLGNTPKSSKSAILKKTLIPIAAVTMVALACTLPFVLIPKEDEPGQIIYGENDVSYCQITHEELVKDPEIFMYDAEWEMERASTQKYYPTDNDEFVVGYIVNNVIYGGYDDNEPCAYTFKYTVQCYDGYMFVGKSNYADLSHSVQVNDIEFTYNVSDGDNAEPVSYIAFKRGKYNYYIALTDFDGITEINERNVERFIKLAFGASENA